MINKNKQFEKEMLKKFKDKLDRYKKYTWEELSKFEELGIEGEICFCNVKIANTMTIECVTCGKIQSRFAKQFVDGKNKRDDK